MMTKKRYDKNTLEFSLEQGVKNQSEKRNDFKGVSQWV